MCFIVALLSQLHRFTLQLLYIILYYNCTYKYLSQLIDGKMHVSVSYGDDLHYLAIAGYCCVGIPYIIPNTLQITVIINLLLQNSGNTFIVFSINCANCMTSKLPCIELLKGLDVNQL